MEWVQIFDSPQQARRQLVENKPQLLVIHGHRICLILSAGRFFAFQDDCTHSGESLSRGKVNYLGEVICPGHGYCFNVKTGRESGERCPELETFPMREDETGLYIGI